MIGFVTRLVAERGNDADTSGAADGRPPGPSTRLYECPDCETVYISEAQATCRSCESSVESVPTERDLDHVSVGNGA